MFSTSSLKSVIFPFLPVAENDYKEIQNLITNPAVSNHISENTQSALPTLHSRCAKNEHQPVCTNKSCATRALSPRPPVIGYWLASVLIISSAIRLPRSTPRSRLRPYLCHFIPGLCQQLHSRSPCLLPISSPHCTQQPGVPPDCPPGCISPRIECGPREKTSIPWHDLQGPSRSVPCLPPFTASSPLCFGPGPRSRPWFPNTRRSLDHLFFLPGSPLLPTPSTRIIPLWPSKLRVPQ